MSGIYLLKCGSILRGEDGSEDVDDAEEEDEDDGKR